MLDQDCENLTDIPSPRDAVAVGEGAGGEGQPQIYVRITVANPLDSGAEIPFNEG